MGLWVRALALAVATSACTPSSPAVPPARHENEPPAACTQSSAIDVCEAACDRGDGAACALVGYAYEVGRGVARDPPRALGFYVKGCAGHDGALACFGAATLYEEGKVVATDVTRAATLYERACASGRVFKACSNLGRLYLRGNGVPRDVARAVALFRTACEGLPSSNGCNGLGLLFQDGEGVPKDPRQAAALFERGCAADDWFSCINLANALFDGDGIAADEARGISILDHTCQVAERFREEKAVACLNLGRSLRKRGRLEEAVTALRSACDLDATGCGDLGSMLVNGRGVAVDLPHGIELLRRACEARSASACNNLGRQYFTGQGVPQDRDRALSLWRQACALGDKVGCSNVVSEERH